MIVYLNKLNVIQHAALRRLEWSGNKADGNGPFCPSCFHLKSDDHKENCYIREALYSFTATEASLDLLSPAPMETKPINASPRTK